MVEGRHGVKQVRHARGPLLHGSLCVLNVGLGMPDGHANPASLERRNHSQAVGVFWGDSDVGDVA